MIYIIGVVLLLNYPRGRRRRNFNGYRRGSDCRRAHIPFIRLHTCRKIDLQRCRDVSQRAASEHYS